MTSSGFIDLIKNKLESGDQPAAIMDAVRDIVAKDNLTAEEIRTVRMAMRQENQHTRREIQQLQQEVHQLEQALADQTKKK